MSSPAWNERRWQVRQKLYRRERVLRLRKQGITWPPVVGQLVCDCRYQHARVVSVDPSNDDVVLEDGFSCSIDHCLDPVDHADDDHPEIPEKYAESQREPSVEVPS